MSNRGDEGEGSLLPLLVGLGVGFLLGGASALLLAPRAGSETRAQLKGSADDALHKLRDSMDELRAKVEETAARVRKEGQPSPLHASTAGSSEDDDLPGS